MNALDALIETRAKAKAKEVEDWFVAETVAVLFGVGSAGTTPPCPGIGSITTDSATIAGEDVTALVQKFREKAIAAFEDNLRRNVLSYSRYSKVTDEAKVFVTEEVRAEAMRQASELIKPR